MLRPPSERLVPTARADEAWRTPYAIDADRIFYSPEFRRLSGVTQVVPPQDGYQFHDRLTHSLKVAQVAETLALQLLHNAKSDPDIPESVDLSAWVEPGYCYVAGLAHDIGHPPFGHAGEKLIQGLWENIVAAARTANSPATAEIRAAAPEADEEAVTAEEDLGHDAVAEAARTPLSNRSFEGNAQSTRIVCSLSFRKDKGDEPGLNPTLRSVAAIAKYPWLRDGHPQRIPKLAHKWSFYPQEAEVLERIKNRGFVHVELEADGSVARVSRWVEAEIMDWADDITYAVHDLEDFFRAGLIPLHRVRVGLDESPSAVDWSTTDFDFVSDDEIRGCFKYAQLKLQKLVNPAGESLSGQVPAAWRKIKEQLLDHLPQSKFSGTRRSHAELQKFGSTLIKLLSAESSLRWDERDKRIQLQITPSGVIVAEFFKALNSFFVIESSMLASMQYGQTETLKVLHKSLVELSEDWLKNLKDPEANRRLPARLREYLTEAGDDFRERAPEDTILMTNVAVIDYICSLRDIQATHLTDQLRGASGLSLTTGSWLDT